MSQPKGLRPSAPHKLAARAPLASHPVVGAALAAHADGSAPLPDSVDLTQWSPPILGQSTTATCFAHSLAGAIATTLAAAGQPLGYVPSPASLARLTYAKEQDALVPAGQTLPERLVDDGAELLDVISVGGRYGVVPMGADNGQGSDATPDTVTTRPDFAELERASETPEIGCYGIDIAAPNLSDQIAAALASKIELVIGFWCSAAFEGLQPGQVMGAIVENPANGDEGGHAVRLSGYRTAASGEREFLLTNSWPGWCEGGRCWVSMAFVRCIWEAHVVSVARKAAQS